MGCPAVLVLRMSRAAVGLGCLLVCTSGCSWYRLLGESRLVVSVRVQVSLVCWCLLHGNLAGLWFGAWCCCQGSSTTPVAWAPLRMTSSFTLDLRTSWYV
jgi:hypothetical protein